MFCQNVSKRIFNLKSFKVIPNWPSSVHHVYMWQSHVEIKDYSVTYFERIITFEAPSLWTFLKGGGSCTLRGSTDILASTKRTWTPPLTEVQRDSALNTAKHSKYIMAIPTQDCHMCTALQTVHVYRVQNFYFQTILRWNFWHMDCRVSSEFSSHETTMLQQQGTNW